MNKITKEKFYKIYSNLPLNAREEIIAVVDNEPITWKIARLEIDNNTKLSEIILDKLKYLTIPRNDLKETLWKS